MEEHKHHFCDPYLNRGWSLKEREDSILESEGLIKPEVRGVDAHLKGEKIAGGIFAEGIGL